MNNKKILRNALPFIIIFFISLAVATYTYVQRNLSGASAADSPISVSTVNLRNPLGTDKVWEWSIIATTDQKPSAPVPLTYVANWCLTPNSSSSCTESQTDDFFYQVGSGTLTINARETISHISHQSVNCGRIEILITQEGRLVGRGTQSTQETCSKSLTTDATAYANSPSEFITLLNVALRFLTMFFGGDGSDNDGSTPTNPGGENPVDPGSPGDVCPSAGATCKEVYRELCNNNGQAGTRVCYKYGTCSAPGSGVQCSWGSGSHCEEKCETGTAITDPVPPIKPPQGSNPGNPGGGQPIAPREPIPPSSDANAQLAINLADHVNAIVGGVPRCGFPGENNVLIPGAVTQFNAQKCVPGFTGSRNDGGAIQELIISATTYGRGQNRNRKTVTYNHLQCVGFVEGAATAASGSYDGPTGHAASRTYSAGSYTFFRVGQQAFAPNDLAVWGQSKAGPWGHIAYVTGGNANTMIVIEANQSCIGCVRSNAYNINEEVTTRKFAGFLRRR